MAYTKEKIKKMINVEEPDYHNIAKKFGENEVKILIELTKDQDVSISSKAISTLGWIDSDSAIEGIENGVKSTNPILKISAAQALKRKSEKTYREESGIGEKIKENTNYNITVTGHDPNLKSKSDKITELFTDLLSDEDVGVKKFTLHAIPSGHGKKFENKLKDLQNNEKNKNLKKLTEEIIKKTEK